MQIPAPIHIKIRFREVNRIVDPPEMEEFLGQVVTVKDVKEARYSNADLIEVYFEEGDGTYFLIEEIEEIIEDAELEESDISIEDFLGI